jgi:hypothetical protein
MTFSTIPPTQQRQLIQLASKECNPRESGLSTRIQQLLASRGIVADLNQIVANLR